jgi:hypothetical protein
MASKIPEQLQEAWKRNAELESVTVVPTENPFSTIILDEYAPTEVKPILDTLDSDAPVAKGSITENVKIRTSVPQGTRTPTSGKQHSLAIPSVKSCIPETINIASFESSYERQLRKQT